MLFRFVIAFLPRSKCFLISWLQSSSTVILELKERKSVTSSTFSPSISHEMMGLDAMILVFWMLTLLFHLYQEAKWQPTPVFLPEESHGQRSLMGYSPRVGHDWVTNADTHTHTQCSAIRVVSFAYLRLLIFLSAILIPAYDSSSLAFHMMYFA